jgi:hypothetical protein
MGKGFINPKIPAVENRHVLSMNTSNNNSFLYTAIEERFNCLIISSYSNNQIERLITDN